MQAAGRCDTLIIGGGVVGMAIAYFLKTMAPEMEVAVIEREPDYEHCSTLRASGGCRVQFSCPENIRMSLFSIDFIRRFPQLMATATHEAPIDWVEGGYLFVVPHEQVSLLEANHAIHLFSASRQEENRNSAAISNAPTDFEPTDVGQHDIEDDEIDGLRLDGRQG